MTTISSPRPSIALSSRRTSTSTDTTLRNDAAAKPGGRRNRAALREFYGLKDTESAHDSSDTLAPDAGPQSEIDRHDFDAEQYVTQILDHDGLETVLRVEAGLLKDIRGLDGERKSLVYDNYSKLIGATDTIRKMRGNMEPLRPAFTTLTPVVQTITDTAVAMLEEQDKRLDSEADVELVRQRAMVRRLLDIPADLELLLQQGRRDEAARRMQWARPLLEKWQKVPGATELLLRCEGLNIERENEDDPA